MRQLGSQSCCRQPALRPPHPLRLRRCLAMAPRALRPLRAARPAAAVMGTGLAPSSRGWSYSAKQRPPPRPRRQRLLQQRRQQTQLPSASRTGACGRQWQWRRRWRCAHRCCVQARTPPGLSLPHHTSTCHLWPHCRAWPKKAGPFDNTPQRPEPGKTLKYFDTQEGLLAAASDPLLQPAGADAASCPLPRPTSHLQQVCVGACADVDACMLCPQPTS
jgi:hypothetical protein